MTQEDKDLLLKDLSARVPYGVKIYLEDFPNATLVGVVNEGIILHCDKYKCVYDTPWNIEYVKPYLFPLSSMTMEHRCKVQNLLPDNCEISFKNQKITFYRECNNIQLEQLEKVFNFFNLFHFDYRGLIKKGLALDATNKNIY